jgi:hypothetical protein
MSNIWSFNESGTRKLLIKVTCVKDIGASTGNATLSEMISPEDNNCHPLSIILTE